VSARCPLLPLSVLSARKRVFERCKRTWEAVVCWSTAEVAVPAADLHNSAFLHRNERTVEHEPARDRASSRLRIGVLFPALSGPPRPASGVAGGGGLSLACLIYCLVARDHGCRNSGEIGVVGLEARTLRTGRTDPCSVYASILAHARSFRTARTRGVENDVAGEGGSAKHPGSLCSHRSQRGDSRHPGRGGQCSAVSVSPAVRRLSPPVRFRPAAAPALGQ
jgi:hypothetical protein